MEKGIRITGASPGSHLAEIIEIKDHPWFLGCQFHPEFKSRPTSPHPLFSNFIAAALQYRLRGVVSEQPSSKPRTAGSKKKRKKKRPS